MDVPAEPASHPTDDHEAAAVVARAMLRWASGGQSSALLLHAASSMLVLQATDSEQVLPPLGTAVEVDCEERQLSGRLAEHGRGGRFLVSLGDRPVRRTLRLRVSLPAVLRSADLSGAHEVEIVDLTTGGARVRGVELPVGSQVTLDFVPPGRDRPVTVRASVAHGTHDAAQPWIGVTFRLVAMRGGR
jgi:hypothetical protein